MDKKFTFPPAVGHGILILHVIIAGRFPTLLIFICARNCWTTLYASLPKDVRRLIVEMVVNNPTWGQEGVADELSLELGILVSPRTV